MTFTGLLIYGASTIAVAVVFACLLLAVVVLITTPRRIPSDRAARRIAAVQAETSEELAVQRARHILA